MDYPSPPVRVSHQVPAVVRNGAPPGVRTGRAAGRAARGALWTLFAALALGAAWLLTFPYDAWQQRLLTETGHRAGLLATAEGWTAGGPTTIEWNEVSLVSGGMRLRADRVSYRLSLTSLARALVAPEGLTWAGLAGLGAWSLDGSVRLGGAGRDGAPDTAPFGIQGILHAAFEPILADSAEGGLHEGTVGRIDLANVTIEGLRVGDTVVPSLSFQNLSLAVACRGDLCRIESVTGTGPNGRLSGNGAVTLRRPLAASEVAGTLSLSLTEPAAQPGGDTRRAAPAESAHRLTVTGPLAHPRAAVDPAP